MPALNASSQTTKRAALFRNGRNQALRIPRAFEFPGTEVMVYREGDRLIIEPIAEQPGLLAVLAGLKPVPETFPEVDAWHVPLDDILL